MPGVTVDTEKIAAFCREWKIKELSVFGSVLREDFHPDSDIDILVSFAQEEQWTIADLIEMLDGLREIFGREVDLVEKETLRNPYRRYEILRTREVLYAA